MDDTKDYYTRNQMETRYYDTVLQMLVGQAYREYAAAQLFGHGISVVPSLHALKSMTRHLQEEIQHYEMVATMYQTLVDQSIDPLVYARLAQQPIDFAQDWFELAMAQFLYDRGGYWQLQEYEDCSFVPYRKVVAEIVGDEAEHQALGESLVVELCLRKEYQAEKQSIFNKWLRYGLLSFGRPNSVGADYAVKMRLRKRDPHFVMQDFITDIKPVMKRAGLLFPSLKSIGIEARNDIDLSLH